MLCGSFARAEALEPVGLDGMRRPHIIAESDVNLASRRAASGCREVCGQNPQHGVVGDAVLGLDNLGGLAAAGVRLAVMRRIILVLGCRRSPGGFCCSDSAAPHRWASVASFAPCRVLWPLSHLQPCSRIGQQQATSSSRPSL